MKAKKAPETIDEYIAQAPDEVRPILSKIRTTVHAAVSNSEEKISYRMPAFRKNKRVFFYFAAFQSHIGIYPPVGGDPKLKRDLEPYRGPKGNLKFPLDSPISMQLIRRVAKALAQEYAEKKAG
jgi:uncharacterized protein YdhG (YjbR/CyaY superfamily)